MLRRSLAVALLALAATALAGGRAAAHPTAAAAPRTAVEGVLFASARRCGARTCTFRTSGAVRFCPAAAAHMGCAYAALGRHGAFRLSLAPGRHTVATGALPGVPHVGAPAVALATRSVWVPAGRLATLVLRGSGQIAY